tara:strand:- start:1597 stop:2250 length:654 start_codon:yes stop_codon:yes gene_type:complete
MTIIYSIEGNIGSGKSTFVDKLKSYFKNNKFKNYDESDICFLEEPVSMWENIKNENNENIIECFYKNQEKYAFSFQIMAYISRLALLRKAIKKKYKIIFTERCVFTDKNVFAKMLFDSGMIEKINFEIYCKWFDEFIDEFDNFKFIYIKTEPKIAHNRIIKRNRTGEDIPLEYIKKCHNYHEDWLKQNKNVTILNGNVEKNVEDLYTDWILEIMMKS